MTNLTLRACVVLRKLSVRKKESKKSHINRHTWYHFSIMKINTKKTFYNYKISLNFPQVFLYLSILRDATHHLRSRGVLFSCFLCKKDCRIHNFSNFDLCRPLVLWTGSGTLPARALRAVSFSLLFSKLLGA